MARFLIIDDSLLARHTHSNIIHELGHDYEQATNGQEGLDLARKEHFDIVLVDLMMPRMDGIGFLTALKEERIDLPVIVLSADIQETKRAECFALGARGFIEKPAKKQKLAELLQQILDSGKAPS